MSLLNICLVKSNHGLRNFLRRLHAAIRTRNSPTTRYGASNSKLQEVTGPQRQKKERYSQSRPAFSKEAMASAQQVLLSPAELAYLHSTLSLTPPIRPDGRKANQFRPLTAETGILPGTNGSARVCFADGTEAIVGAKAEIEKTPSPFGSEDDSEETGKLREAGEEARGRNDWLEIAVEIPGSRDDDAATVFLANMLSEALLADGEFSKKLRINNRFHWKLYLDVCSALIQFWVTVADLFLPCRFS